MIYDKFNINNPINLDDKDKTVVITDKYGVKYSVDDLMVNQLITIRESENSEYITVIFTEDEVSGSVSAISYSDDETIYTINGIEYKSSYEFEKNFKIESGTSGIFYLDINGKIANYKGESAGLNIAYIIGGYKDDSLDEEYGIRLFNEQNTILTLKLADKVKTNDGRKKADVVYNELCDNNGKIKNQIIRYRTNSNDEISLVETAEPFNTDKDILQFLGDTSELEYQAANSLIGGRILVDDKTQMFVIPSNNTRPEQSECIYGPAKNILVNGDKYTLTAYRFNNDTHSANVLVQNIDYSNYTFDSISYCGIYDKEKTLLNNDDEVTKEITVVQEGMSKEYILHDMNILNEIKDKNDNTHKLKRGDVILYDINNVTNEIMSIKLLFDYETKDIIGNATRGSWNSSLHYTFGYAYDVAGTSLWMTSANPLQIQDLSTISAYNISGVVYYDLAIDKLVLGNVMDIKDFIHTGSADRVFIYQKQYNPKMIYILN